MTVHNALTGTELHEPKNMSAATAGAADIGKTVVSKGDGTSEVRKIKLNELDSGAATNRQIGVSDGAGAVTPQNSCRMGWSNYNDLATVSTPIVLTPVDTFIDLTNDGAGAQTVTTFELPEVTALWNTTTDKLDLSDLQIGDTVDIRIDVTATTTGANHAIEIQLNMDTAPITANFPLLLVRENFKSAGTFNMVRYYSLFIGSAAVRDGVHSIRAKADTGTTDSVVVNGWFIRAVTRSDY
jgi:hypothetical protein